MDSFLHRISGLSAQRLTLLAVELQEKVAALERAAHEPIAVVGMACRMPGACDTPSDLWSMLHAGRDAVSEITDLRLQLGGHPTHSPPNSAARYAALLDSVEMFDPRFFDISPGEATSMDPQQRLLLEVVWEALENAAIPPDSLAGSETGVFIGISSNDYGMLANRQDGSALDKYLVTGAANSIASGRISYLLGLQGPNIAVDTSCSSSATSVHLACQSLRRKEVDLAIAGGVSLALLPQITEALGRFNMLALDGHCKTFSEHADGFARGEGCGVIVLKRLSDATRNHDNIIGLIRGSACNQDGRTSGLTAPSGRAQERVIAAALKDAGATAAEIDLIEAHGTGTSLGDPIEVSALGRIFTERATTSPVALGSIKTNIGHLEAAAGIAGIIKVLLALQQETIPPSLHTEPRSKWIPWNELPFTIPTTPQPWKTGTRKRLAGVSSFGFSGTNVHLILEEAPPREVRRHAPTSRHLITASAKSRHALNVLAQRYAAYLDASPDTSIDDFARTVTQGRSHFAHRLSAVVSSTREARDFYAGFVSGAPVAAEHYRHASEKPPAQPAFVFPAISPLEPHALRTLTETSPSFRQTFERCEHALGTRPGDFPSVRALTSVIARSKPCRAPRRLVHVPIGSVRGVAIVGVTARPRRRRRCRRLCRRLRCRRPVLGKRCSALVLLRFVACSLRRERACRVRHGRRRHHVFRTGLPLLCGRPTQNRS